jgi:hypothetical protein
MTFLMLHHNDFYRFITSMLLGPSSAPFPSATTMRLNENLRPPGVKSSYTVSIGSAEASRYIAKSAASPSAPRQYVQ